MLVLRWGKALGSVVELKGSDAIWEINGRKKRFLGSNVLILDKSLARVVKLKVLHL